jgi:2-amino-4-hydroxy-6-hydroxymethyldihydropteridine diphosphokinase
MGGTLALIGLGSNLGDREANLDVAVAALAGMPGVRLQAVSSYHETTPVGGPGGQGGYLNAAAAIETTLDPFRLHATLRAIEAAAGRERKVRWAARTLDLDLLTFGDELIDTPELVVPHPRMAVRRFVLAPLAEIAPDVVEPITSSTVSGLLANLDRRPGYVPIDAADCPTSETITRLVARSLGVKPLLRSGPPDDFEALRRDAASLSRSIAAAENAEPDCWIISGYDLENEVVRWWRLRQKALSGRGRPPARADVDDATREMESVCQLTPKPTFRIAFPNGWSRECLIGCNQPFLLFPPDAEPSAVAADIIAACLASRAT